MNAKTPSIFDAPHGPRLAYHKTEGKGPTVVMFGGLMSDMTGTKAVFLEGLCQSKGLGYVRFDYSGHGQSSGAFRDGTIGSWLADGLSVIDTLTEGPVILVGSSLGGWLVLLAALARPDRVKGLVCLAPAADFTERLLRPTFGPALMKEMDEKGEIHVPSDYGDEPYIFTKTLFEEGKDHLLLDDPVKLDIPVRILHGAKDTDVPPWISEKIIDRLTSTDAHRKVLENSDHRLSEENELEEIKGLLEDVVEKLTT